MNYPKGKDCEETFIPFLNGVSQYNRVIKSFKDSSLSLSMLLFNTHLKSWKSEIGDAYP